VHKKICALILAATLVAALAPGAGAIGVFGSYWNGKDPDDGYGLGLIHKFAIVPIVSVDVRASWVDFGDDVSVFPLEATARAKLGLFYGGLGLGYYIFDANAGGNEADNAVGGFGVLGIEFSPLGIGGFGELKYTIVETDVGPATMDAEGIGVNVGVVFRW
jgi:hypothetical protein